VGKSLFKVSKITLEQSPPLFCWLWEGPCQLGFVDNILLIFLNLRKFNPWQNYWFWGDFKIVPK